MEKEGLIWILVLAAFCFAAENMKSRMDKNCTPPSIRYISVSMSRNASLALC